MNGENSSSEKRQDKKKAINYLVCDRKAFAVAVGYRPLIRMNHSIYMWFEGITSTRMSRTATLCAELINEMQDEPFDVLLSPKQTHFPL